MTVDSPQSSRRGFLAGALHALALGLSAEGLHSLAAAQARSEEGPAPTAGWATLVAVQEHLLPSEPGAPGARELGAAVYLRLVLRDSRLDSATGRLMPEGAAELDAICVERYGESFPALTAEQRERTLRDFEKTPLGRHWLGEMLDFLLEAALGDPSYGGNPNQIGWKWLEINPGFPLPLAKLPKKGVAG